MDTMGLELVRASQICITVSAISHRLYTKVLLAGKADLWVGTKRRQVESWVGGGSTPGWQLCIALQLCPNLHHGPRRTTGHVPVHWC